MTAVHTILHRSPTRILAAVTSIPVTIMNSGAIEDAFRIMKDQLNLRLSLKPYIESLMEEASTTGAPLMRTMFYEFPDDSACWDIDDQYMFGSRYLC